MPTSQCPASEDLQLHSLGKLDEEHSGLIDQHLDECRNCQAMLGTVGTSEDTLVKKLRQPAAEDEFSREQDFRRALQLVQQIGHEPSMRDGDFANPQDDSKTDDEAPLGTIRDYKLLSKLGEGGMGAVYKAVHMHLNKVVALKLLPREQTADAHAVARFKREMLAVGAMQHHNIVQATDAGEHDGVHFLVMEYVKGQDLSKLSQQHGPLPIPDACELIRLAAEGLQHAYENGLIHRDIKPSNLMLANTGEVKILDLGLALLQEQRAEHGRELTTTGQMMGTLDYMAPEQGDDSHEVDIRADIYALGASLYRLLTGQVIYHGAKHRTPVQKMMALAMEPAPPIQSRREEVPAELAAVVHQMLAKDPEQRIATPAEVAALLAPFCEGANLQAYVSSQTDSTTSERTRTNSTSNNRLSAQGFSTAPPQPKSSSPSARPPAAKPRPAVKPQPAPARAGTQRPAWPRWLAVAVALGGLFLAAVVVFTLKTKQGVITVEVDEQYQDQISIQVDGADGPVVISKANDFRIALDEGKYSLKLDKGTQQFQLNRDQVTVSQGDKIILKVTLREAAGDANQPVATNQPRQTPPTESTTPSTTPTPELPQTAGGAPSLEELDAAHKAGYRIMGIGEWPGEDGAIAQDSTHLVVCDGKGQASVINFFTKEVIHTLDGIQPPIAFSPSGTQLAGLASDLSVGVWDWKTGEQLQKYSMPTTGTRHLELTDDGEVTLVRVAPESASMIEMRSSNSNNPRQFTGHSSAISHVDLSPDHQFLSSISGKQFKLWRVATATVLHERTAIRSFRQADFTSDSRSLFIREDLGYSKLDVLTGKVEFEGKFQTAKDLGWNNLTIAANQRLAAWLPDRRLRLFDPATGKTWEPLDSSLIDGYGSDAKFSPDGQFILATYQEPSPADPMIRIYRLPTCRRIVPIVSYPDSKQSPFDRFGADIGVVDATHLLLSEAAKNRDVIAFASNSVCGLQDCSTGRRVRSFVNTSTSGLPVISSSGRYIAYPTLYLTHVYDALLGRMWEGNRNSNNLIAFLADDDLCVVRRGNSNLDLRDSKTGRTIGSFVYQAAHGGIRRLIASRDGLRVAAATSSGFVYVWDLSEELNQLGESSDQVIEHPIGASRIIRAHQSNNGVHDLAFTQDGKRLITCDTDRKVCEWDLTTGNRLRSMETPGVDPVCLAVDSSDRVITGGQDGVLRVQDLETGQIKFTLPGHIGTIVDLKLTWDGKFALSRGMDGTSRIWRLPPAEPTAPAPAFQGEIKRIVWQFYRYEVLLASALLTGPEQAVTVQQPKSEPEGPSLVRMWDINTEQEIRRLVGHDGPIVEMAVSPDERIIAGATEKHVYLWAAADGRLVYTLDSTGPLAFTPDSKQLLAGGREGAPMLIWDVSQGSRLREIKLTPEPAQVEGHFILSGERFAASYTSQNKIIVWDWKSGDTSQTITRQTVNLRLHDSDRRGEYVVLSDRSDMEVVNLATTLTERTLRGHSGVAINGAKLFDNDRFLLSWGIDQTFRIWDFSTGEEIYRNLEQIGDLNSHRTPLCTADITTDREHLLTISKEGTIRKVRLPSEVIQRLKSKP